jgi:hypothetical protein
MQLSDIKPNRWYRTASGLVGRCVVSGRLGHYTAKLDVPGIGVRTFLARDVAAEVGVPGEFAPILAPVPPPPSVEVP